MDVILLYKSETSLLQIITLIHTMYELHELWYLKLKDCSERHHYACSNGCTESFWMIFELYKRGRCNNLEVQQAVCFKK